MCIIRPVFIESSDGSFFLLVGTIAVLPSTLNLGVVRKVRGLFEALGRETKRG